MTETKNYFFCGIGGSGMLPLALILRAQGHEVKGSDRSLDQGHNAQKFEFLRALGIELFSQDGSGLTRSDQIFVASTAVEDSVPDAQAAKRLGVERLSRAEMLAQLFNGAPQRIGVAGTSGKSTTTGMIGWILDHVGLAPTVMNGAVMKNFVTDKTPFASALVGENKIFVSEVDESDGSIALFDPTVAVLNNVAVDHKPLGELRSLFSDFVEKSKIAVLNLDNEETAQIARHFGSDRAVTYSLLLQDADLSAKDIAPAPDGISFAVVERITGETVSIKLPMPGRHNVANALAALCAARACGVSLKDGGAALEQFQGIRRRLELVGTGAGIPILDDFAHNPDKISASLSTLHEFPGRLLVMFQPHGFGPLKLMRDDFIACFKNHLSEDDYLIMPQPVYFGGTTDKSVTSEDIVRALSDSGLNADAYETRSQCGDRLMELAQPGDRIIIMGARDDTLTQFAGDLLDRLSLQQAS